MVSGQVLLVDEPFNYANDSNFLPRTGWATTGTDSWKIFNPSSTDAGILYNNSFVNGETVLHHDTGSSAHIVESSLKCGNTTSIGGVCAAFDSGGTEAKLLFSLVLTATEDAFKLDYFDGGTYTLLDSVTGAGIQLETWYVMKVEVEGASVNCYVDDALFCSATLDAGQQASLGTYGGVDSYSGFINFEYIKMWA
jgi:hypothetical protein